MAPLNSSILESKYFALITSNIDNGIVISDQNFVIEWANTAFQKITGYSNSELVGKIPTDFLFGQQTDLKIHHNILNSISKHEKFDGEILNYNKEGKPYWVNIQIIPALDEHKKYSKIITVVSDITTKKEFEEEFRRIAELQEFIIECTNSAIISTNFSGLIHTFNKGAEKILGYNSQEIIENYNITKFLVEKEFRDLNEITHSESNWFREFIKFSLKENQQEWTFVSRKGVKTPMLISASILKNRIGDEVGFVFVCADNTENKKFEKKQLEQIVKGEQVNIELANANQKASEALKLKDDFIAKISHEIRTPMNGIIGLSNLLLEEKISAQQFEFVKGIQSSGNHLLHIINDLLDISKINSGKISIEEVPFNIELVAKNVINNFIPIANKRGIEVILLFEKGIPTQLIGDVVKFNQILFNILENAIKFTETGYVSLSIGGNIKNNLFFCETTIKDTGIGISDDRINIIFENFVQAPDDKNILYGGTGLGLSISKQLIEVQGGNISVSSQLGIGTEFKFMVPFKISKNKQKTSFDGSLIQDIESDTFLTNKSILIAEDNNINLLVITNVLKKWGAITTIAQNGKEVLDFLKATSFDLILMDLQMPILDGISTTKIIRNELGLKIPIIALTANALIGEDLKCIEIGMQGYISKPFKPNELKSIIQKNLNIEQVVDYNIDLTLMQEISGGNQIILNEMLNVYLTDLPEYLLELSNSILEKDMPLVGKLAHKIRSSILLVGIHALIPDFEYVEKQCNKVGYENECILKANKIISVSNKSMDQVRDYIKNNGNK